MRSVQEGSGTPEKTFASEIAVNVFLLKLSGVLPCRTERPFSVDWRGFIVTVGHLCTCTFSISYAYEFAVRARLLEAALESFTMLISFAGGQARFLILLWWREKLRAMLDACEELWASLRLDEKESVRQYTLIMKKFTYYYLSSCAFTILGYVAGSIVAVVAISRINPGYFNHSSLDVNMTIPERSLPYAFFFEVHDSPFFQLVYIFQVFAVLNVGLVYVGVDTIGPLLISIACGHFAVIRTRMIHLDENRRSSIESVSCSEMHLNHRKKMNANLSSCVRYHRRILTFCTDIEKLANVIFLTQLIGSTYNISIVGFKLAGDDPDKIKYVPQILIAVIQLFLCNWPPDLLLTESESVASSAYSTPWYHYSTRVKRSLRFIISKSQRPVRLTAGNFMYLSLETFASMISSAASFFTVIRSMH